MKQVSDSAPNRMEFGVYFLSNNREIHWLYAFLASFRKYNPTLPLTLIPYNEQYDQVAALAERFNFNMLDSDSYAQLDALNKLTGGSSSNHMFRKFAVFWGIYDTFLYLDSDILITADLRPIAAAAEENGVDFAFVETFDEHIDHVYHPGPVREKMVSEYQTRAFNAGAWWSRRGLFALEDVEACMEETKDIRGSFTLAGDQPYLNYCLDTRRVRSEHFSDLLPNLMPMSMTSVIHCKWDGSRWLQTQGKWAQREVYMIHFAGFMIPRASMPNYKLYLWFRAQAQGIFKTQLWNLRWQGQRIKWKIISYIKPGAG